MTGGITRSATLKVTSETTTAELQDFARKLDGGMKLRGKKVEGGYELYAKSSAPGLWSRLTRNPRGDARAAVKMVLDNTERNLGGKTLESVRHAIDGGLRGKDADGNKVGSKDIGTNAMKLIAAAADRNVVAYYNTENKEDDKRNILDNRGPGLDKMPDDAGKAMVRTLVSQLGSTKGQVDIDAMASKIEQALGPAIDTIKNDTTKAGLLDRLALSSGAALKYDLRTALAKKNPDLKGDDVRQAFDRAFDRLSSKMIANEQRQDGTIKIGDDVYTKGVKLGKGGFGEVFLYQTAATPPAIPKQIAIKTANSVGLAEAGGAETFMREANAHRVAAGAGAGASNVVGFSGAVRMQDGTIAIAVEYAALGDASKARDKIATAFPNGTPLQPRADAMRLLLLRDIATGLAHMQRTGKDMVHMDLKNENVFIDAGGIAKVGDFGLSAKGGRLDPAAIGIPDVAAQLSPELARHKEAMHQAGRSNSTLSGDPLTNVIKSNFKGLNDSQVKTLAEEYTRADDLNKRREVGPRDFKSVDAWAFGNTAFKMIMGRELHAAANGDWQGPVEMRIAAFGLPDADPLKDRSGDRAIDTTVSDSSRTDWVSKQTGAFAGSTGDQNLDELLNGLLHPDPAQRMTIQAALAHPALAMTQTQIDAARADLVTLLTPPANAAAPQATAPVSSPAGAPSQPNGPTPPGGSTPPAQNGAVGQTGPQQTPTPAPGPTTTSQAALMRELQQKLQGRTIWG